MAVGEDEARAALEACVAKGEPGCWKGGAPCSSYPLDKYLFYGVVSAGCDGGACRVSLPGRGGVFDGAASTQRQVSMTLAAFLAVAVARDEGADADARDAARAVPGFDAGDEHDELYACQVALAGSGAPRLPLRQAMAYGALACVPAWAREAREAAERACDADAAGDREDASVHAWLGAARDAARGTTTAAHYDGYQNLMVVLEGGKRVELWPPGEAALCRGAAAWDHHAAASDLPPAPVVLDLGPGDVGFWPEGWWHRVASEPKTRAVNVWWRGWRHALVAHIPEPIAPFALRTLAHRCAEVHLRRVVDAARRGRQGKRARDGSKKAPDPTLPLAELRAARDAAGVAWPAAVDDLDDRDCYVADELLDAEDLASLFFEPVAGVGPKPRDEARESAAARARFDAKKDRFVAVALATVVRDITGIAQPSEAVVDVA